MIKISCFWKTYWNQSLLPGTVQHFVSSIRKKSGFHATKVDINSCYCTIRFLNGLAFSSATNSLLLKTQPILAYLHQARPFHLTSSSYNIDGFRHTIVVLLHLVRNYLLDNPSNVLQPLIQLFSFRLVVLGLLSSVHHDLGDIFLILKI